MKIKLLIIALLAGIAGQGQQTYRQYLENYDDHMTRLGNLQTYVELLDKRMDSLERRIDSLEKRPYLQLGEWPVEIWPRGGIQIDSGYWQWPHLDTLPLMWDSASLRRYIQPSGTGGLRRQHRFCMRRPRR